MSKLLNQKSNLAPPNSSESSVTSRSSSLNSDSYLSYNPPNLPYTDRMSPFLDSISFKKGLKKLGNIDSYINYHKYDYNGSVYSPSETTVTTGILSELGEFLLTEDNNNLITE